MLTKSDYTIKEILAELQTKHKELVASFPGVGIYSAMELSSEYIDKKWVDTETPVFVIEIIHHQTLTEGLFCSNETYAWTEIDKFEDVSVLPYEHAYLKFITPLDFDTGLIPEGLLIFRKDYSDTNRFQIHHHRMEPCTNTE